MIDNHHHHQHVGIAFGSCNRPLLSQSYWKDIESYHPSYYLWTGDAIYAKNHTIEALEHAYHIQLTNEFYRSFIHSNHGDDHDNSSCSSSTSLPVSIDGIWDDHDYGVNDGGRYVHQQDQRRQLYHDFIASSNSGCDKDHHQSNQYGSNSSDVQNDSASPLLSSSSSPSNLYHSRDIHLDGLKIKILFLDTRSHRDDHYIKSLGEYNIKGSALLASVIRATYSVLRFGRQYKGQILGDDQWTWLATTLQSSDAQVHIIISSIQVLTTNPVIESWGHFPLEKSRLFDLLKQTNPANLLLLSGDVHMAEMLYANYTNDDGSMGQWIEVTSSGLTHSCNDGLLTSFFCPLMNDVFSSHRYKTVTNDSLYMERNFGYLDIRYVKDDDRDDDLNEDRSDDDSIDDRDNVDDPVSDSHHLDGRRHDYGSHWILNVSIISLEPNKQRKVMLSHLITINNNNTINDIHESNMLSYSPKKIVDVKYGEFAHISPYYIIMICYILCLAVLSACLYINMRYIAALKTKIHKLKSKRN